MSKRAIAREFATQSLAKGDPAGWFEQLYAHAKGDASIVPWADLTVNPNLTAWLDSNRIDGTGRKTLVIGCGLGDDAEALAALGFHVTAFDISPTCVEWCRQRFPHSSVEYSVADVFSSPASWQRAFDFVLESYTLQVLPHHLHQTAIRQIAEFAAVDGTLLVIARGRDQGDDPGTMPWPLLRSELDEFANVGLTEVGFEDYVDDETPPVRRFRIEYRRAEK